MSASNSYNHRVKSNNYYNTCYYSSILTSLLAPGQSSSLGSSFKYLTPYLSARILSKNSLYDKPDRITQSPPQHPAYPLQHHQIWERISETVILELGVRHEFPFIHFQASFPHSDLFPSIQRHPCQPQPSTITLLQWLNHVFGAYDVGEGGGVYIYEGGAVLAGGPPPGKLFRYPVTNGV